MKAVAYRGGQRGRFALGGTLRGVAKEDKKKKKKKREKRDKSEKKRNRKYMGEACNYSKTKMEHLSFGTPMLV